MIIFFLTLVIDCIFITMKMCSIYLKHFVFAVLVSPNKYRWIMYPTFKKYHMGKLISNNEYHKYKVEFLQVDLEANTFICDLANTMLIRLSKFWCVWYLIVNPSKKNVYLSIEFQMFHLTDAYVESFKFWNGALVFIQFSFPLVALFFSTLPSWKLASSPHSRDQLSSRFAPFSDYLRLSEGSTP